MASQSSHLAALRRYTPDAHVAISVLSNVHGGGVAAPIIGALHGALPGEGAAYLVALGCDIAFGLVDSLRSLALSNAPALLALAGSLPRLIAEIAAAHDTAHPQQAAGLQELSALFRTFGVARLPVVDADADADAEAEVDAEGGLEGACAIAREFVSAMVTALPAPENRCQETLDFLLAIVRGAPPADGTPRPTDAPSRLRAGVYSELPGIFGVEALGHDGGRATLLAAPPAFFELCVAFERAAARGASRGIDFPRLAEFALEALRVSRGDVHALGAEAAKLLAEVPLPALLAAWLAAMEAPGAGPPGGAGAAADGVPGHEQLLTDLRTLTLGPCDFGVSASDATALALDDTCGYDIEVGLSRALPPDAVLTAGTLWEVQCALLAPMLPPPGAPPPFVAPGDAAGWEALPPLLTALRRLRKSDLRATASRARTAAVHAVHGGASVANVPNFDALLAGSVTLSFGLMDMIAPQCFAWNLPRFPPYSLLFGGLARDIAFVMQCLFKLPKGAGASIQGDGSPAARDRLREALPAGAQLRFRALSTPAIPPAAAESYVLMTFAAPPGLADGDADGDGLGTHADVAALLAAPGTPRLTDDSRAAEAAREALRALGGTVLGVPLPNDKDVVWTPCHYARREGRCVTRYLDAAAVAHCRGGVITLRDHTDGSDVTCFPLPRAAAVKFVVTSGGPGSTAWAAPEDAAPLRLTAHKNRAGATVAALGSFNGGAQRVAYGM